MFDDAAAMLDRVCIEPAAVYSQATSPHFAKMEVLNLASEGLNDGPGTPLQVCIISILAACAFLKCCMFTLIFKLPNRVQI